MNVTKDIVFDLFMLETNSVLWNFVLVILRTRKNELIHLFNDMFNLQAKDNKLTVIATDSFSVEPKDVRCVNLMPGERYDVVLHTKSDVNIGN